MHTHTHPTQHNTHSHTQKGVGGGDLYTKTGRVLYDWVKWAEKKEEKNVLWTVLVMITHLGYCGRWGAEGGEGEGAKKMARWSWLLTHSQLELRCVESLQPERS